MTVLLVYLAVLWVAGYGLAAILFGRDE
ncbi:membrane protein [Rhodococcus phage MacGully]|nr:membrane protein [Rhodococcus phage MacGully]